MSDLWPDLPYESWKDTCATVHRWSQIVGKIRLAYTPWTNHSWHSTLYVTPRGLGSSPIPHPGGTFDIEMDFFEHATRIRTGESQRMLPHAGRSVADYYRELLAELAGLGLEVKIHPKPNEIEDAVPFDEDRAHASYDPEYANRFARTLIQVDRVFKQFRSRFLGKVSPVHFFWGGFDHAVTRFSGRRAPAHPGGIPNLPDWITREAYSHEVSSCGFWPGSDRFPKPAFYSYAYPEPDGYSAEKVAPAGAFYSKEMGEFFLLYEDVRRAPEPDEALLEFLESTYAAAARCGKWDRAELEAGDPWPPRG